VTEGKAALKRAEDKSRSGEVCSKHQERHHGHCDGRSSSIGDRVDGICAC
jgi:hypothetical protein